MKEPKVGEEATEKKLSSGNFDYLICFTVQRRARSTRIPTGINTAHKLISHRPMGADRRHETSGGKHFVNHNPKQ